MIKFGTGGWRAIIGRDFIERNICLVAEGICALMKQEGKTDKPLIVGYDHRFLSDVAAKWMAEVFAAHGVTVWLMNRSAPTPLVMHTVKRQGFYYGVEITASHNPSDYNGIKLIVQEGRDAPLETTERLERLIAEIEQKNLPSPRLALEEACDKGLVLYRKNPFNDFIDDILEVLDVQSIREHGARVLFDPMYGSGTEPLLRIFAEAKSAVVARGYIEAFHKVFDAHQKSAAPALIS